VPRPASVPQEQAEMSSIGMRQTFFPISSTTDIEQLRPTRWGREVCNERASLIASILGNGLVQQVVLAVIRNDAGIN
jgi:hypothetical protein